MDNNKVGDLKREIERLRDANRRWMRVANERSKEAAGLRLENEQLKAQVLQLQKDNGELGNRIDTLTKENADLRGENERLKAKRPARKRKHRRTTSRHSTSG